MSSTPIQPDLTKQEVCEAVSTATMVKEAASRDAVLLAAGDPLRVFWANDAASVAFGTTDPAALSQKLFFGERFGGSSVLLRHLPLEGARRLVRLRVVRGFRTHTVTVSVGRSRLSTGRPLYTLVVPLQEAGEERGIEPNAATPDLPRQVEPAVGALDPAALVPSLEGAETAIDPQGGEAPASRFLWRTDAHHHVLEVSGRHPDLHGITDGALIGQSLPNFLAERGCDPEGLLTPAFEGRRTWSGLSLAWPIEGSALVAPVLLGAVPLFDTLRRFQGFRGFAVADFTRPVPARKSSTAPKPDTKPETDARNDTRQAAEALPGKGDTPGPILALAPDPAPPGSVPDSRSISSYAGDLSQSGLDHESAAASPERTDHASSPATAAIEAQTLSEPSPPLDRGPMAEEDDVSAPFRMDQEQAASAERQTSEPSPIGTSDPQSSKVVRLRPYQSLVPYPQSPPGALGQATGQVRATMGPHDLSSVERSALHEIARALGARMPPGDASEHAAAGSASPLQTEAQPVAAAHPVVVGAQILDGLPIAVWFCEEGGVCGANRAFLDLTGYGSAEALAQQGGIEHLLGGSSLAAVSDGSEDRAFSILDASRQSIWVEGRGTVLVVDGRRIDFLTMKRAQHRSHVDGREDADRRDSDDEGQVMNAAADALAIFDEDGRLLRLNRAGERLFGYTEHNIVGETLSTFLAPESRVIASAMVAGSKAGQDSEANAADLMGRKADGTVIPLRMSARRLTPDKLCVAWTDRSEVVGLRQDLARAREDVDRLDGAKSDFLAKLSHELRTPLNAILGFAEVILDERFGPVGNHRYRDYIRDIHESGRMVLALVNDLLDLSRMEAGRLDMSVAAVDANRIVSECVSQLQAVAHRERVIMRMSLPPRLPAALVDERAFRQVMTNILSNAVKFNEPGGQVIVSTAVNEAGSIAVRVRDTGIGMSDAEIASAMEPFRQIATTKPGAGNGLGLPITKALVEANRATMSIKSRKHEGTLVEILLRAEREPMRVPAA